MSWHFSMYQRCISFALTFTAASSMFNDLMLCLPHAGLVLNMTTALSLG